MRKSEERGGRGVGGGGKGGGGGAGERTQRLEEKKICVNRGINIPTVTFVII